MRKAFTLIEILVVVAIVAITISVSMVGMGKGTAAARLRGATRDAFATLRQARSIALVSQKPCVLTYVDSNGEDSCARIEITTAQLMNSSSSMEVETISGEKLRIGDGESGESDGGETIEQILFAPIAEEVLKDVRVKVVKEGEDASGFETEVKEKSKISAFSNVDYLLGKFEESRKKAKEEENGATDGEEKPPAPGDAAGAGAGESTSVVWETNGRCVPHRVWIYPVGSLPENGLCISVDRFGAAKVLGKGED